MRHSSPLAIIAAVLAASLFSCSKDQPKAEPAPTGSAAAVTDPHRSMPAPMGSADRLATASLEGKVVETMDVNNYTYVNLETSAGKVWAAVPKAQVAVGSQVAVDNAMKMGNFHSPTLNRTFSEIYFGVLRGAAGPAASAAASASAGSPATVPSVIQVSKAAGPNAHTVAEIIQGAEKLNGKSVVLQAMVVKVNTGILERNWIHVRDGSGSDQDKSNDVLVTSSETPKVGDIVVVKGKVAMNKDFGAGYSYKVLIEEATFTAAPASKGK